MYLYLEKDTFLHRLNPITKIIGVILLSIQAMIFNHPIYLLFILVLVIIIGIVSRSLANIKRFTFFLVLLAGFSTVLWSLFLKIGSPVFNLLFLSVSKESFLYGLGMGMRLITMVISGLIFLSCTNVEEVTWGLNKLGLPFPVSFSLSLGFRLVPVLLGSAKTVKEAQITRGLDLETGGIITKIRKYAPLLIPIFAVALRKVEGFSMSLEGKGFGVDKKRTYYLKFKVRAKDYLVIGLLMALNIGSIYLRIIGYGVVF
ncbi:MAG: energy-coupling factor transporter transmembrane component T [bacterium]|nr:energy-coupling factor transporter transmembrane component T [bacterium]